MAGKYFSDLTDLETTQDQTLENKISAVQEDPVGSTGYKVKFKSLVNSESTNKHIPTAKAVYDIVKKETSAYNLPEVETLDNYNAIALLSDPNDEQKVKYSFTGSVNPESDDVEIPTARAVYEAIQDAVVGGDLNISSYPQVDTLANRISVASDDPYANQNYKFKFTSEVSDISTHEEVPTARAVYEFVPSAGIVNIDQYEQVETLEEKVGIVSDTPFNDKDYKFKFNAIIDESATDAAVPTTKAVYDLVKKGVPVPSSYLYVTNINIQTLTPKNNNYIRKLDTVANTNYIWQELLVDHNDYEFHDMNAIKMFAAFLYTTPLTENINPGPWKFTGTFELYQMSVPPGTQVFPWATIAQVFSLQAIKYSTTGSGRVRRLTVTTTSPVVGYEFTIEDAVADERYTSYVRTRYGFYAIVDYIAPNVVNIAVPEYYENETNVEMNSITIDIYRYSGVNFGTSSSFEDHPHSPTVYNLEGFNAAPIVVDEYSKYFALMVFIRIQDLYSSNIEVRLYYSGVPYATKLIAPISLEEVSTFNGRLGNVLPTSGDYSTSLVWDDSGVTDNNDLNNTLQYLNNKTDSSISSTLSTSVIWRSGGISLSTETNSISYAVDYITLVNASIVIGNTVTITVNATPVVFTASATPGGTNFLIGATASDTATNLANSINSSVLNTHVLATSNLYGSGTVFLRDIIGGYSGNSNLVSTNNTAGFKILANCFFSGGYSRVNLPSVRVKVNNVTSAPTVYPIQYKEHLIAAENNVYINLNNQLTFFTIAFDSNLDPIQYETEPGVYSYFTQSQQNPLLLPSLYKASAVIGVCVHTLKKNVEQYADFGGSVPYDYGSALKDLNFIDKQGGTDFGNIISYSNNLKLRATQSTNYAFEANPLNPVYPFRKIVPERLIKTCTVSFRNSGGSFIRSYHINSDGIDWINNIYDNGLATPATYFEVNTNPIGSVGANQWSARFFYVNPLTGEEQCQVGQTISTGTNAPSITSALSEYNSLVKDPLFDKAYLQAIIYVKSGATDYSVSTSYKSYSYLELKSSGVASSSSYTRQNQLRIVYFGKHGYSTNNGTNDDDAIDTMINALAKAKSLGGSNVVLCCLDSNTYDENLTGTNSITNSIQIYAPNATIEGNIEFSAIGYYSVVANVISPAGTKTLTISTNSTNATNVFIKANEYINYSAIVENKTSNLYLISPIVSPSGLSVTFSDLTNVLRIKADTLYAVTITSSLGSTIQNNTVIYDVDLALGSQSISKCYVKGRIREQSSSCSIGLNESDSSLNISYKKGGISAIGTVTGSVSIQDNSSGSMPAENELLKIVDCKSPSVFRYRYNNTGSNRWFLVGTMTAATLTFPRIFNVKVRTYTNTNADIGETSLIVHSNLSGIYSASNYKITAGKNYSERPVYRIYRNSLNAAFYVYVNLKASVFSEVFSGSNNLENSGTIQAFTDCGTSTDPSGISGYILLYDNTVDDAGYYSPLTINWYGPFVGSPITSTVIFNKLDNGNIMMNFSSISATGNGNSDSMTAASFVPSKYRPVSFYTENKLFVKENSNSYVSGTATVYPDGTMKIDKSIDSGNVSTSFSTINGQAIAVNAFSLVSTSI